MIEDLNFKSTTEQRASSLGKTIANVLSPTFYQSDLAPAHVPPISVLSMSYGIYNQSNAMMNNIHDYASESDEVAYDSRFSAPRVAFVAASGDNLGKVAWPSASPNVLSVGGTRLSVNASGDRSNEVPWVNPQYESMPTVHNSGAGYGTSVYERLPFYQAAVRDPDNTAGARITPDVSDVSTGLSEYDRAGWVSGGGTSAAAPQWAALIAVADQARELSGAHLTPLATVMSGSLQSQLQEALYYAPATDYFLNGDNATQPAYQGYNLMTGLGSPNAADLIGYLATWSAGPTFATIPASTTSETTLSLNVDIDSQSGELLNNVERGTVKLSIIEDTGHVVLSGRKISAVTGGMAGFNAVTLKGNGTCTFVARFDGVVAESHTISVVREN